MTQSAPFADLPGLLAWLDNFDEVERIHIDRLLADRSTTGALARDADALVYGMTRRESRTEVAGRLGTTVSNVQRAVSSHIRATGTEGRRGPARGEDSAASTQRREGRQRIAETVEPETAP